MNTGIEFRIKTKSLLLTVVILIMPLMSVLPVQAAAETYQFKEVWNMDSLTTGVLANNSIVAETNGEITNGIYQFSIAENGGNSGKALQITNKISSSSYPESAFRFARYDSSAITDWTGAEELMFYLNVSEYGTQDVSVGFSLRENNYDGDTNTGTEGLNLKPGAEVYICKDGANNWETITVSGVKTFLDSNKMLIPAGFKGWIRIPLNMDTFTNNYGKSNDKIDLKQVYQFNILVSGNATTRGKSAYIDSFGIVGLGINGKALPVTPSAGKTPYFSQEAKDNSDMTVYYNSDSGRINIQAVSNGNIKTFYHVSEAPKNGDVTIYQGDNSLVYTPKEGFYGKDTFTIRATDFNWRFTTLTFTVEVKNQLNPNGEYMNYTQSEPDGTRAESFLSDYNLKGYVGSNIKNNIAKWQLNALQNNPYIITAIENANSGVDNQAFVEWYGEFAGKLLTGMVFSYQLTKDPDLYSSIETLVSKLGNAQGADGYLGVYSGSNRMGGQGKNWDVWGNYHSIFGLYQWYKVSGSTYSLNAAAKALDYIYNYFTGSNTTYASAGYYANNLAISHAFALLYQKSNNDKYLTAAKQIVDNEWKTTGNWMKSALNGVDFSDCASSRWECLHGLTTLGNLYEIEKNEDYYKALENLWWSMVKTDRHNTGGFSTHEEAIGTPYMNGIIETCCMVSWMAFSTEYLQLSKNSYVADELELSFFNGMLGSLMKDDTFVTYNTPMSGVKLSSQTFAEGVYTAGQGIPGSTQFNCCQANAARGLSQLSQWGVISDSKNLYVNYYGPSAAETLTPGGNNITIAQETEYPKNGAIKITLNMDKDEEFALKLRIPTWSATNTLKINGENMDGIKAGEYYTVDREWKNGDVIELNLEMAVHYWLGEELCQGYTSVYYGPVLLTADTNNTGSDLNSISFTTDDFEKNMTVYEGESSDYWIKFLLKTQNGNYVLIDFASAGQNAAKYTSWLKVKNDMEYIPFTIGGNPLWNNRTDIPEFTVKTVQNEKGSINASAENVPFGKSTTVTVKPYEGCTLEDVTIDGRSIGAVETYTLTNVRSNVTVSASFSGVPVKYNFDITTNGDGSVSPSSAEYGGGSDQTFSFLPEKGGFVKDVIIDGQSLGEIYSYTFYNINSTHSISVVFDKLGDINDDGIVNASDALMALQYSVKKINLNDEQINSSNVDDNIIVNASDALCILQYAVKKINVFPRENKRIS